MGTDPLLASIGIFAGNFAPRGWAYCNGQLMSIAQNTALFSLVGTTYGGDGRTTFGLPDLRGRVPIHSGTGPGLSTYRLGQRGGVERVNLSILEIPQHNHAAAMTGGLSAIPEYSTDAASNEEPATNDVPAASNFGSGISGTQVKSFGSDTNTVQGAPISVTGNGAVTVGLTGGSQAHTNIQPFLAVHYVIALVGVFPSRN
ncbi:phage tail protein [Roseivirga pacifica]|uniref:phage tail protein n=1 Tax=Roseivirga pacifica TaxID=1267423 RepID=UPI00227A5B2C|nr:tail fiber protein [Roseivirga pacifica]